LTASTITCPDGHANSPEQHYCGECGAFLDGLCPNGHSNPPENVFCGECGTPLTNDTSSSRQMPEVGSPAVADPAAAGPASSETPGMAAIPGTAVTGDESTAAEGLKERTSDQRPSPETSRPPVKHLPTAIEHTQLGELTRIGKGGQGTVFRAPNIHSKFAPELVYKQYKPKTLAEVDVGALAALPALLSEVLSEPEAHKLVSIAAWPWAVVETDGTTTGFVMPAIPDAFYIRIDTVKGPERALAEFQHLLNNSDFLAARGITLTDDVRLRLLREVASSLVFLHERGVCVGDISPRNLLFEVSTPAVYFVDCDTMRVNGTSALPPVETPGWEVPAGEELATAHSDAYKLGLLALRLILGDQDATHAGRLPDHIPPYLRRLISETLDTDPARRPLPTAWVSILDRVIREWTPTSPLPGKSAPVLAKSGQTPSVVLRSRPPARTGPNPTRNVTAGRPQSVPPPSVIPSPPNPQEAGSGLAALGVIAALFGVALLLFVIAWIAR